MIQVEDDQIRGVWVVAQQDDKFLLCQEADKPNGKKPRFGKQPLDFLAGAAETRESDETVIKNARRAMIEELGLENGYEIDQTPAGLINVDCAGGQFLVAVMKATLNREINVSSLKPSDPDTIIIGLTDERGLFEKRPHRAGSAQAVQLVTGALCGETIIQAERYE